ncbi:MAG: hypothetical protein D6736_13105 [Nitrospinota bacterium]|nr:MAG: hypothetical protein D6736_13105 [Nitrospinota bacterium]
MSNVTRHSKARHLTISLECAQEQVVMTLTDDGQGFDPSTVVSAPDQSRGLGIAGMRERASLVSGRVTVDSAPGRGTMVRVTIPLSPIFNTKGDRQSQGGRDQCRHSSA